MKRFREAPISMGEGLEVMFVDLSRHALCRSEVGKKLSLQLRSWNQFLAGKNRKNLWLKLQVKNFVVKCSTFEKRKKARRKNAEERRRRSKKNTSFWILGGDWWFTNIKIFPKIWVENDKSFSQHNHLLTWAICPNFLPGIRCSFVRDSSYVPNPWQSQCQDLTLGSIFCHQVLQKKRIQGFWNLLEIHGKLCENPGSETWKNLELSRMMFQHGTPAASAACRRWRRWSPTWSRLQKNRCFRLSRKFHSLLHHGLIFCKRIHGFRRSLPEQKSGGIRFSCRLVSILALWCIMYQQVCASSLKWFECWQLVFSSFFFLVSSSNHLHIVPIFQWCVPFWGYWHVHQNDGRHILHSYSKHAGVKFTSGPWNLRLDESKWWPSMYLC